MGTDRQSIQPAAAKCAHARNAIDVDSTYAMQLCRVNS